MIHNLTVPHYRPAVPTLSFTFDTETREIGGADGRHVRYLAEIYTGQIAQVSAVLLTDPAHDLAELGLVLQEELYRLPADWPAPLPEAEGAGGTSDPHTVY